MSKNLITFLFIMNITVALTGGSKFTFIMVKIRFLITISLTDKQDIANSFNSMKIYSSASRLFL